MAESLSEKLGLIVATDLADDLLGPCKMEYDEIVRYFEEDRVETVEAALRHLEQLADAVAPDLKPDCRPLGRYFATELRRDLLTPPSPKGLRMADLKPCPFCGGTHAYSAHNGQSWSVWCPDCDTNAVQFWPTEDEATAAWNHRAAPPSPGEGREPGGSDGD